jgi:hypothetical protein
VYELARIVELDFMFVFCRVGVKLGIVILAIPIF